VPRNGEFAFARSLGNHEDKAERYVVNLEVKIGQLILKNPVTVASGTFSYGEVYTDFYDPSVLGAIFLKTVTLDERVGNPPPRTAETPSGMLNAIGLMNPGVERFLSEIVPTLENIKTHIIANISAYSPEDFARLAERISGARKISALELNLSCPNIEQGKMIFGTDARMIRSITSAVVRHTHLPVIVKLTPNVTDIGDMARAAEDAGATAVSVANTFLAMAIDIETRRPKLANVTGGLSGPAIKPITLRMVWQVAQAVKIPIIGSGGIMSAADAIEYVFAGATAIAVGTANFVHPRAPREILAGIEAYLVRHGCSAMSDIIGTLETGL
jgi:dihydroorotate dehydrogenase (NAD+) catalytic subunit